jgi:hypothetical protein
MSNSKESKVLEESTLDSVNGGAGKAAPNPAHYWRQPLTGEWLTKEQTEALGTMGWTPNRE